VDFRLRPRWPRNCRLYIFYPPELWLPAPSQPGSVAAAYTPRNPSPRTSPLPGASDPVLTKTPRPAPPNRCETQQIQPPEKPVIDKPVSRQPAARQSLSADEARLEKIRRHHGAALADSPTVKKPEPTSSPCESDDAAALYRPRQSMPSKGSYNRAPPVLFDASLRLNPKDVDSLHPPCSFAGPAKR